MSEEVNDFKARIGSAIGEHVGYATRECYGASNSARFVSGGFLCGIPNLDSLNQGHNGLCVFSSIKLSPSRELHTAIFIRKNYVKLLDRLKAMVSTNGKSYSDSNNNCALYLASDGNLYLHNKAKDSPNLARESLNLIGPGIEPDNLYISIYGDDKIAPSDMVEQLRQLVGRGRLVCFSEVESKANVSQAQHAARLASDVSLEKLISSFRADITDCSLQFNPDLCLRVCASLLSKRFFIATGLAGSGKTKLAQAVSRWLSASDECCEIVPVGADWSGNENILGYPDGLQATHYVAKPALGLILHAVDQPNTPCFLILDEMNLSHVERYFADILSIIESDEGMELYSGDMNDPETWRTTAAAKPVPPKLKQLPENLFIIGTVNVDETTYMFSPKVLDRANVIEFRMDAGELDGFLDNPAKPDLSKLDGKGASFGKAFVDAAKNPVAVSADVKAAYDAEMLLLFKTLQVHGAEFGYRTAYETARFIHFYKLLGNLPIDDKQWFPGAFDCVVFQKLLPKLHGSRAKLGPVLKKLWFLCVTPHKVGAAAKEDRDKLIAATLKAAEESKDEPLKDIPVGAPYPLSAEKIYRMWRLMIDNGFTSFAEA